MTSLEEKQKDQAYNAFAGDLPRDILTKGTNEIIAFVQNILSAFIVSEDETLKHIPGAPELSGLHWMGRVDVGVLHDRTSGKMSYWVTDIKQSHRTPLYMMAAGDVARPLVPTLVQLWERHIFEREQSLIMDGNR
jgi:hypothetical protein